LMKLTPCGQRLGRSFGLSSFKQNLYRYRLRIVIGFSFFHQDLDWFRIFLFGSEIEMYFLKTKYLQ